MAYNVLFYTSFKANPYKGGTERTTISIATGLKKYFCCKCYSVFSVDDDIEKADCFEDEFHVKFSNLSIRLRQLIVNLKIDFVINQGEFSIYARMWNSIKVDGVIYIMAHHFQPGWEENFFTKKTLLENFKNNGYKELVKNFIKYVGFSLYFHPRYLKALKEMYQNAYDYSDITVLLAKGYIDEYTDYVGIKDKSKFQVIPNSLSYDDDVYDFKRYEEKKKIVLIVSRMDESQKKISIALSLWKKIKQRKESNGWLLKIVGDGPDLNKYKKIVSEERISNVIFCGKQVPDKYYEEASIFMMTSKSEGWGLTITEAQQFGVVPVVLNNCSVFKEIIMSGKDGILVPSGDFDYFVDSVCDLMSNYLKRKNMARMAHKSCRKYSQNIVSQKWYQLFEKCRSQIK